MEREDLRTSELDRELLLTDESDVNSSVEDDLVEHLFSDDTDNDPTFIASNNEITSTEESEDDARPERRLVQPLQTRPRPTDLTLLTLTYNSFIYCPIYKKIHMHIDY